MRCHFSHTKKLLLQWILIASVVLCACSQGWAATWEIVQQNGRQYIPLRCLRDFYSLTNVELDEPKQVRLRGAKGVLDFRANSRECAINGVRIWLSFPALLTDQGWLVSRMDVAKTIEPAMRPSVIKGLSPATTVVLDAGHGGHDGGAASRYGFEKTFALDIARRVKNKLVAGGYEVILTRNADFFIPLHARAAAANKLKDSIFVSIHYNASGVGSPASGIEVFSIAPRGAPSTNDDHITWASLRQEPGHDTDMASFALARAVHTALVGYLDPVDRGLKRARFAVIRTARVPAILVECGFLTNPFEARLIATDAHREKTAKAIAEGISDYKLLATLKKVPKTLADYNRSIEAKITLRDDHEAGVNTEVEQTSTQTHLVAPEPPPPMSGPPLIYPLPERGPLLPFFTDRFPFQRAETETSSTVIPPRVMVTPGS